MSYQVSDNDCDRNGDDIQSSFSSSSQFLKLVNKHNELEQQEEMEIEQLNQKNNQSEDNNDVSSTSLKSTQTSENQESSSNELTKKKGTRGRKGKAMKKVEYQLVPYQENHVFKDIAMTEKCYMLSGGIIVEIDDNQEDDYIIGSLKTIQYVQKHNKGAISINVAYSQPGIIKQFDHLINILQKSQDKDKYDISLLLQQHQIPMTKLDLDFKNVINTYDQNTLYAIVEERRKYQQQIVNQFMEQYFNDDDFTQIITFQIDWSAESIYLSSFYKSKAIIALFGSMNDEYIQFIMRNGLFQTISPYSRRRILDVAIKYYQIGGEDDVYDTINDFELKTLDNIHVKCCCEMVTKRIQYPEHLRFPNPNQSDINSVESISLMRFQITQSHLESIIKIRSQVIAQNTPLYSQLNSNSIEEEESNNQIAQNFEYYMQSELFLQNFYKEKYNKLIQKQPYKATTCSFKYLTE